MKVNHAIKLIKESQKNKTLVGWVARGLFFLPLVSLIGNVHNYSNLKQLKIEFLNLHRVFYMNFGIGTLPQMRKPGFKHKHIKNQTSKFLKFWHLTIDNQDIYKQDNFKLMQQTSKKNTNLVNQSATWL